MLDTRSTDPDALRNLIVRMALKALGGLLLIFLIAAVVAPSLFNSHTNLGLIAAFVLWIACPFLFFFIGWNLLADWRKTR